MDDYHESNGDAWPSDRNVFDLYQSNHDFAEAMLFDHENDPHTDPAISPSAFLEDSETDAPACDKAASQAEVTDQPGTQEPEALEEACDTQPVQTIVEQDQDVQMVHSMATSAPEQVEVPPNAPSDQAEPKQFLDSQEPEIEESRSPSVDGHDELPNGETAEAPTAVAPTAVATTNTRPVNFEIVLVPLQDEVRSQYAVTHSDVVDFLIEEIHDSKNWYRLEYSDGRQDILSLENLLSSPGGQAAYHRFQRRDQSDSADEMTQYNGRKRNYREYSQVSDSDSALEGMRDFDVPEESLGIGKRQRNGTSSTNQHARDMNEEDDVVPRTNSRQLRKRQPTQRRLTDMAFGRGAGYNDDEDELAQDFFSQKTDDEDESFALITSDIAPKTRRLRKGTRRLKPSHSIRAPSSRGSSIEFEDSRRRSGRATRNQKSMMDYADINDDESFYVEDTKGPATPKVISIKEIFKSLPPDSEFAVFHTDICDICNQGLVSNKGPLIGCQGCCLSFHKVCIGYRAQRDHMVTKVGTDNFVLQCKWCIGLYRKKDHSAPSHDMCQSCQGEGLSCAPFSDKKTSKQEEKLRQENGGEDPITIVSQELVNNSLSVLFRCASCKRGWHYEHLPSPQLSTDITSIRDQRLAEYSVDWKCHDCRTKVDKIQGLVAWRPSPVDMSTPKYDELNEDRKEYLVKWQDRSYFHCTWMPGAWIFGVATAVMRITFGKRDAMQSLLKLDTKEAIPEEYLLADVILLAKSGSSSRARSKEEELARISSVKQIFVKFQGLAYDEVVWDSPPSPDSGAVYDAFKAAYEEYLNGNYFGGESSSVMKERVKQFKEEAFVDPQGQPLGIKRGKLMEYQVEGLAWLLYNYHQERNVILADEMGLGKTVQVISLIAELALNSPKCWPFLIVVPNSTCPNWRREIKFWAPDLRVVTYHGGKRSQELAYKYELFPEGTSNMRAHVVVMSYDSAQDDRTRSLFRQVQWAGLVVDEGQRLKNDQNLLYLALRAMRFPFRLLLTGTPLQNNKRELFNLLQFVDPAQNAAKLDEEYSELNAANLPELHDKIRPYFLRRTKAAVLKFLPPMAQIILPVSMTVLQEKLCKSIIAKSPELIKAIFANGKINNKERGSLNNILIQLRKCLCHPFLYSEAIEERSGDPATIHRNLVSASAKLILLEQMLPKLKARGHRVLIFSQFLGQLDIVEDFLNGIGSDYRRLDGSISSLEKQRRIDAFNAPNSSISAFLLSTRAGGVGINLATADTVIILDPDFNPHQDIQALARAHRIGQKNKVLCFQLMTKESVEEKIMQIGRKKMALDHVLIESMDKEDEAPDGLESILKFGASNLFSEDENRNVIRYDDASIDKLLDRSEIEQTETNEEGSAESQFSFAKVWASKKGGFEGSLEEHEDPTLNPSVWEDILKEREAEAQRLAEQNKVVLGRGGRRRQAINYRTNQAVDAAADLSASDMDDEFKAESDDDDDEDEDAPGIGRDSPLTDVASRNKAQETSTAPSIQGAQRPNRPKVDPEPKTKSTKQDQSEAKGGRGQGQDPRLHPQTQAKHSAQPFAHAYNGMQQYQQPPPGHLRGLPPSTLQQVTANRSGLLEQQRRAAAAEPIGNASVHNAAVPRRKESGALGNQRQLPAGQFTGSIPTNVYEAWGPKSGLEIVIPVNKVASSGTKDSPRAGQEAMRQSSKSTGATKSGTGKCVLCNQGHAPSLCGKLRTEGQVRLALDSLSQWSTDAAQLILERAALKERLRQVTILGDGRDT